MRYVSRQRQQRIEPSRWRPPKGYQNGIRVGETVFVAGQVGWNHEQVFESDNFEHQFVQALDNVLQVVTTGGGVPTDIVKMTILVTSLDVYRAARRDIGAKWRERFGTHFPTVTLAEVAGLLEPRALVEIEAIAVIGSSE